SVHGQHGVPQLSGVCPGTRTGWARWHTAAASPAIAAAARQLMLGNGVLRRGPVEASSSRPRLRPVPAPAHDPCGLAARGLFWPRPAAGLWRDEMSHYPDDLGAWWTNFPGSDRPSWAAPTAPAAGSPAPAQDGGRGAASRQALRRRLVMPAGRRERARREAAAEWRRQIIHALREPSLKSGVITLGSGFGGTGK